MVRVRSHEVTTMATKQAVRKLIKQQLDSVTQENLRMQCRYQCYLQMF
jgi:ribosomal protein L19E